MSAPPIHLVRGVLPGLGVARYYWCAFDSTNCPAGQLVYVYEPLFATCEACLKARSLAAAAVKPAVIVPPYPEGPHS